MPWLLATAGWLLAVAVAMAVIINRSNAPSHSGTAPALWPRSAGIPLDPHHRTLVMFVHPQCPCTRASLSELEVLLANVPGLVTAHVMFVQPAGLPKDWARTFLWRKAGLIPGVNVHLDPAGVEARRFHSETSGHTLLYDQEGVLRFHGGITGARGHEGKNAGRVAVTSLCRQDAARLLQAPVFGCPLFETTCSQQDDQCPK